MLLVFSLLKAANVFAPPLVSGYYGQSIFMPSSEAFYRGRKVLLDSECLALGYSSGYVPALLNNGTLPAKLHAVTSLPPSYFLY